jgi:hypothetical protein
MPALIGLFWAFSYALLTLRGAIFHDDWGRLIDNNRLLAVSVGAGAYGLVLKQLQRGSRMSLSGAVAWIAGATLAVMIVRVTLDEMMFEVPEGLGVNLLWSLTWSAYFGLWVMGSLAFDARGTLLPPPVAVQRQAALTTGPGDPVRIDNLELMVISIMAEARDLKTSDRAELAARVLVLGGYEAADGSPLENERARLALRLASKLSEIR